MNFSEIMSRPIMPRGYDYPLGTSQGNFYTTSRLVYSPLPSTCPGCGAADFSGRRCTFCGRTS